MEISENSKYQARVEIEHKFVQSLIFINSGAVLALLGFAQAVIEKRPELALVSFISIRFFCVGLAAGVAINFFRYRVNSLKAANDIKASDRNKFFSYFFRALSFSFFLAGVCYISIRSASIIGS